MSSNSKKQSIAPAIKNMAVGDVVKYPFTRYFNVQNTLVRVRHEQPEKKWITRTKDGMLEVVREKWVIESWNTGCIGVCQRLTGQRSCQQPVSQLLDGQNAEESHIQETWNHERCRAVVVAGMQEIGNWIWFKENPQNRNWSITRCRRIMRTGQGWMSSCEWWTARLSASVIRSRL